MKLRTQCLVSAAAAVVAMLAAVALARAETCTLELKRLESQGRSGSDYIYRATSPQHFFVQMGKNMPRMGDQQQTAAFKKIVKKEPKYESDFPFRSVAKLGSQEFAFALDAVLPTPAPKDGKPDGEKAKAEDKKPKADSAVAKLADQLLKAVAPAETPSLVAINYNRLYFDFNRNGDLTDDKVVEAEPEQGARPMTSGRQSYWQFQFPRLDVTIDAEGTKLDSSFFLTGQVMVSPDFSYASISLNAAAYREGDITLDGKKRHIVLIDFNSNGRFDDQIKIVKVMISRGGQPVSEIHPQQGDMLLVDPNPSKPGIDSPYDITSGDSRHYVSKLVNIDGRFYGLKISPAGDKLTLDPSSTLLGNVTNPNDGFRAVIYSDQSFLKIRGNKGTPVPVPEGEWKLLSYTINQTERPEPSKPAEKKEEWLKEDSLWQSLVKTAESLLGGGTRPVSPPVSRSRNSVVTAQATAAYTAVKVGKGETVELPFGPPYKPVVTAYPMGDQNGAKQMSLQMSLVGSTGEVCTNMMVDGGRPSKPEFTITDDKGKVIEQGSFEYG